MQNKKQIIIIGGGTSIKEGISKGLWDKIKGKFVIGLNYSFNYFKNPIFQCFVDNTFYNETCDKIASLPLIIGSKKDVKKQLPNTIFLPAISKYYRDIKHGVYKNSLVGLYALTLAIYFSNPGDEIYLLGMDYGEARKSDFNKVMTRPAELNKVILRDKKNRALTHFYQGEINHRGIGKINYYNGKNRAEQDYKCYRQIKDITIYNVSLISKIPEDIFPKISYEEFFKKLDKNKYNQNELREEIRRKLKWIKKK